MTSKAGSASPRWLESPAELNDWLSAGRSSPLALDTEFERVSTFFPIPGLVQLGQGDDLRLVEPSVAEASEGFRSAMADPERPKLLYAMSEDLELFRHWLGIEPRHMLDLQIAASLAGLGFSLGYARLVETLFNETLDKSATRSDWISRPLSDKQCQYALDDIRYLQPAYEHLLAALKERGFEDAWREETARFAEELGKQSDPSMYFHRLRGGWQLSDEQQSVLYHLSLWRENECRGRDRPRGRILADNVLIGIADRMPQNKGALGAIDEMPSVVVRRYGDTLLELVESGRSSDVKPDKIEPPLTRDEQALFKQVKGLFRKAAEDNDVPVELLSPRKRVEACLKAWGENTDASRFFLEGWRGALIQPFVNDISMVLKA